MVSFRGRVDDAAHKAIIVLLANGLSVREVSSQLGLSRCAVTYNRSRPLPSKRGKPKPPPLTRVRTRQIKKRREAVEELARKVVVRTCGTVSRTRQAHPSCAAIRQALQSKFNVKCSVSTIRRDLIFVGLRSRSRPRGPYWRVPDASLRHRFARTTLPRVRRGEMFLFSDEKYVDCDDHGCRTQWVAEDEDPQPRHRDSYAMKLHVWGLIGVGVKRLVVLPDDRRVNADMYVRRCLAPNRAVLTQPGVVFQQDNASAHVAHRTTGYLSRIGAQLLEWPARSPDLSPIENLWALLARQVSDRQPVTQEQLKNFTIEAWEAIPQQTIDAYVLGFRSKLERCVQNRGRLVVKGRPRATPEV